METKPPFYYDFDFAVEGEIISLRGSMEKKNSPARGIFLAHDKRSDEDIKRQFDKRMKRRVREGRAGGLSDELIERCFRLNLGTYGFDDRTFPIAQYMKRAEA